MRFFAVFVFFGLFVGSSVHAKTPVTKGLGRPSTIRQAANLSYGNLSANDMIKRMGSLETVTKDDANNIGNMLNRSTDLLLANWDIALAKECARLINLVLDVAEYPYYVTADAMDKLWVNSRKNSFLDIVKEHIKDDNKEDRFLAFVEEAISARVEGNG